MKCLICNRQLTAPASIAAGIGPECSGQFAGRVASAGSSTARLDELDALGDAEVSRWTKVARRAAGRGCLRDARMFIERAEREAAALAIASPAPAAGLLLAA